MCQLIISYDFIYKDFEFTKKRVEDDYINIYKIDIIISLLRLRALCIENLCIRGGKGG